MPARFAGSLLLSLFLVLLVSLVPAAKAAAQGVENERYTELYRFLGIWRAVHDNDPAEAKRVLDGGFDVNMKCPSGGYMIPGLTALHLAADSSALPVAEVLLDGGADVEVRDLAGCTALHHAVARLLENSSPQQQAQREQFLDLLLSHKADINAAADAGYTPLHQAVLHYADSKATVDLLVAKGARHDLFTAAAIGDVQRATDLLAMRPELARRSLAGGATPLHFAVRLGRRDVAELLLEAGANLEARDEEGKTPLHHACLGFYSGQPEVLELLLKRTRNVDVRDNRGMTPLHHAAHYWAARTNIPAQLIAKGAKANARDDGGLTPLHYAAYYGQHIETCELLLAHGADLHDKTTTGVTAVELIRMQPGHRELNDWLDKRLAK